MVSTLVLLLERHYKWLFTWTHLKGINTVLHLCIWHCSSCQELPAFPFKQNNNNLQTGPIYCKPEDTTHQHRSQLVFSTVYNLTMRRPLQKNDLNYYVACFTFWSRVTVNEGTVNNTRQGHFKSKYQSNTPTSESNCQGMLTHLECQPMSGH